MFKVGVVPNHVKNFFVVYGRIGGVGLGLVHKVLKADVSLLNSLATGIAGTHKRTK